MQDKSSPNNSCSIFQKCEKHWNQNVRNQNVPFMPDLTLLLTPKQHWFFGFRRGAEVIEYFYWITMLVCFEVIIEAVSSAVNAI